jgi:predicted nucleic acid-binding protein
MSGDFIDSNVILYLFSGDELTKKETAEHAIEAALARGDTAISFQVVQEVLSWIIHRASPPLRQEDVLRHLEQVLLPLWRVSPSEPLYRRALEIHWRYRYAFYDSLIIAAALEAGCTRLLSEDLQDGQRIDGLTIVNPFGAA